MRKVICLLFVASLAMMLHAEIIKFEAEDARYYYQAGTAWQTVNDEAALGGKYITAVSNLPATTEDSVRRYSFYAPAGTYDMYTRYQITNPGDQFNNDSFFASDSSFAIDAGLGMYNGLPGDGLDGASTLGSFAWVQVDTDYVSQGGTAYFIIQPREDGLLIDAFAFVTQGQEVTGEELDSMTGAGPYDPLVTPDLGDGVSGVLLPNNKDVQVTFNFKASGDPNVLHIPPYPVDPGILGHYLYLSSGSDTDPNLYLLDYIPQAHNADPYLTDPNVSYGPVTLINAQGKSFSWQAEEVTTIGSGNSGDPNNLLGPIWTFNAIGAVPTILNGPVNTYADEHGDASLSVTVGSNATHFRWFKVVGDQDTDDNEETNDLRVSDGGIYSDTQTATLVITGGTAGNGAEGRYYCIAYNGDPDGTAYLASEPSAIAWLWIPRLVNYYTFESMSLVDGNDVTPNDVSGGYALTMMSNDTGSDVPSLEPNVVTGLAGSAYSLQFDNPRGDDPNATDAEYAQVNDVWAGAYEDITISAWVYWNGGGNWQRIVDFGYDTNNYMFLSTNTGGDNGQVRFAVKVNAASEQGISTPTGTLPRGEWTYVTVTLKEDTARIYINGAFVQSGQITFNPVDYGAAATNYVGRSHWGGDAYFDGLMDDLKIYNYARTLEQIAQDYLAVRGEWVCDNENDDLTYDFNGNCQVDIGDLVMFVSEWLDETYRVYPD